MRDEGKEIFSVPAGTERGRRMEFVMRIGKEKGKDILCGCVEKARGGAGMIHAHYPAERNIVHTFSFMRMGGRSGTGTKEMDQVSWFVARD